MKHLLNLAATLFFLTTSILFAQQDCSDAIIACGNSNIELDVNGFGIREFPNSCSSNENNSVWLQVTVVSGGTLGFTLTPNSSNISEDYDFFVFGPNATCANLGSTIRCSTTNPQAAGQGNNLTGMNASENDFTEGPGAAGNSFVRWLDVNAGETYFIVIDRPIGNSPFSLEWTGTAQFSDPPTNEAVTSGTPLDLESCDIRAPFTDGFTNFDLSTNTAAIQGSQNDVTITYHESASDANIGINSISTNYNNTTNPQTIYARITNNTTGCFEITDFQLTVNLGPNIVTPTDFIICDDLNDGNNQNGQAFFDLTTKNTEILDGLSASDFNISYYRSEIDAENKSNALSSNYYNSDAFNQTIFVRVEDIMFPDCKTIVPLNLIVNSVPDAFNHTLLQCDKDGTADGLTQFNLNEANSDLTGGNSNNTTLFFSDAARTNLIDASNYTNTSNPQIIYVTVIDNRTSCLNFSELTLDVSVTDANNVVLPAVCDDDGMEDGLHFFNLSDADNLVLSGLPSGLNLNYYETYTDALLEVNTLSSAYTNTTPYSQTIFARVEDGNDCYGISEVTLSVSALPEITPESTIFYCLNNFPETETINAAILHGVPNDYTYNWSTNESTYSIEINSVGNYTVTVTNASGCSKTRTVQVEASNVATISAIEVNDSSENNTITVLTSGEGIYEYCLSDTNGNEIYQYQTSNSFENIRSGIYTVNVFDVKNNCGITSQDVSVIGFPKFFTPNNDGINDTWQVIGVSALFQPNTKIQIFNRYGKLLKELNPTGSGWNGMLNGKKLPQDDYWFSVKLQDGRIFKNHFSLKY